MKSIMILIAVLLSTVSFGEEIKFEKFTSLNAALAQSKKEKKPIFVDTWATWCGWCTYMDENIFSDDQAGTYFNSNFIRLKLNADGNNSDEFMSKYDISGLPALLIIDENGEVLSRNDGAFNDVNEFIEFGELAYYKLKPETSPWYIKGKEFDSGNRNYLFLKDYALSLLMTDDVDEKLNEVTALYWKNTPTNSLVDTTNFLMFYIFVYELSDPLLTSFIEHKHAIIESVSETLYYQKGLEVIQSNLDDALFENDKNKYNNIMQFTEKVYQYQDLVDYDDLVETIKDIWKEHESN